MQIKDLRLDPITKGNTANGEKRDSNPRGNLILIWRETIKVGLEGSSPDSKGNTRRKSLEEAKREKKLKYSGMVNYMKFYSKKRSHEDM